jgi:hypothetical protein
MLSGSLAAPLGRKRIGIYDCPEYVRWGALDVVRFIVDDVGGIMGGMKLADMAECFRLECAPHNWGGRAGSRDALPRRAGAPNNVWFEMTQPQTASDRPYKGTASLFARKTLVDNRCFRSRTQAGCPLWSFGQAGAHDFFDPGEDLVR